MIDPVLICNEFLPTKAAHDLDIEVTFGQIDVEDKFRDAIWTTVSYQHLSDLSLRMYKAGYVLNQIEGNLANVVVNRKTGVKSINEPLIMVIYIRMDDESIPAIDPSRN